MNVTLWDTSSDVRKELSIQDDRTESDNRIEVMLLIGIAENNLPHIARWESTKPPYAEPHVRWCGRSVNVKIGGKCLLWLAFTSYPIVTFEIWCVTIDDSLLFALRFISVCSPLSVRYTSFMPSLCHRLVNGGRSSLLRRMNEWRRKHEREWFVKSQTKRAEPTVTGA